MAEVHVRARRSGLLLIASFLALVGALVPVDRAIASTCAASGPGSYTVAVCFTEPTDGDTLTGDASVTTTATVSGGSASVRKMIFYLSADYLITDFSPPFTFELPTTKFVDGARTLEVEAVMQDGFVSDRASIGVDFNNGITEPPVNTNTFTPTPGTTPDPGDPFVIAAVGDGASGEPASTAVTDLIASWNPNLFLYLGDVYDKGTVTEFHNWYGTGAQWFSRFLDVTDPTIGNHEYEGGAADGYFDYWDNVPDSYSFDAAGWHFISLNSTSQFDQTDPGTPQYEWLGHDLDANLGECTLAFWHHPILSIGPQGDSARMDAIWSLLATHDVQIVLTGHDHNYQRWEPLDGDLAADPAGVTPFVVGAGGHGIQKFVTSDPRVVASDDGDKGALRIDIEPDAANFSFVSSVGTTVDSGSIPCTAGQHATTTKVFAEADARVAQETPDRNFGTAKLLKVDKAPRVRSYLRFDVPSLSGTIGKVELRLWATKSSADGYLVRPAASDAWEETGITWANQPGFGGASVGSSGAFGAGWTSVDLTGLVTGQGKVSIVLVGRSALSLPFHSREAAHPPRLLVVTLPA